MSYGEMGGNDLRVVSGINLILQVMKELRRVELELEKTGKRWDHIEFIPFGEQLKIVAGTSGDALANNFLVKKLNILNGELKWKYPHKEMIRRSNQDAIDACLIAYARHFQKWEKAKFDTIIKALGNQTVLENPELLPRRVYGDGKEEYLD